MARPRHTNEVQFWKQLRAVLAAYGGRPTEWVELHRYASPQSATHTAAKYAYSASDVELKAAKEDGAGVVYVRHLGTNFRNWDPDPTIQTNTRFRHGDTWPT